MWAVCWAGLVVGLLLPGPVGPPFQCAVNDSWSNKPHWLMYVTVHTCTYVYTVCWDVCIHSHTAASTNWNLILIGPFEFAMYMHTCTICTYMYNMYLHWSTVLAWCVCYSKCTVMCRYMSLSGVTTSKWFVRAGFIETITISLPYTLPSIWTVQQGIQCHVI